MNNQNLSDGFKKVHPFIGHAGVGSRVEVLDKGRALVIRETFRSQLFLICTMGLVTFFPVWLLVFQNDKIKGGLFGKAALGITSLVCAPFFLKHIFKLLSGRRIEIDKAQQRIQFIRSGKKVEKFVLFSDIESISIDKSIHRSKGQTENFTLILTDKTQQIHQICTSDREADIVEVFNKLRKDALYVG